MQSQENTIKAFLRTAVDLHQEHGDRDIGTSVMKTNDLFETFLKSVTEPLLGSALKGPKVFGVPWAGLDWGHGRVCLSSQTAQGDVTTIP